MGQAKPNEPPSVQVRSQRIYSGRIISLDVETLRDSDGTARDVEIVRHPGASAVVPLLDDPGSPDPRILLLRQYRHAPDEQLLEIPAGRFEPGEDRRHCAERELKEETGMTAANLEPLSSIYTTPGFSNERIHIFIAWNLTQGDASPEADEKLSVETHTLSQAVSKIQGGGIIDAKTAIGLLLAEKFISRR